MSIRVSSAGNVVLNIASDPLAVHLGGSVMDSNATLLFDTNSLVYADLSGSGLHLYHTDPAPGVPASTYYMYDGIHFNDSSIQHTAGLPLTGGTMTGAINVNTGGLNNTYLGDDYISVAESDLGAVTNVNAGYIYLRDNFAPDNELQISASNGITFPDGSIQTTAYTGGGGGGGDSLPLAGGTMTGPIYFDGTSGQYISKGNFDTSRGGNYGISLVCSIGYEFNWQAGWLTTTNQGSSTPRPLYLDAQAGTTLRVWSAEYDNGTEVSYTGITFPDGTVQTTSASPVATVTVVTGLNEAHHPASGNTVYVFDTCDSVIELPEDLSMPVGTQMVFVNTDGSTLSFNPLCQGAGVVTSSGGKYTLQTTGAVCAAIKLSLSPITWVITGELTA